MVTIEVTGQKDEDLGQLLIELELDESTSSDERYTALCESTEKWRKIAYEGGVDKGENNCALCQLYFDDDCAKCPIREKTCLTGCEETPYENWVRIMKNSGVRYIDGWHLGLFEDENERQKARDIAIEMHNFLFELSKEEEK